MQKLATITWKIITEKKNTHILSILIEFEVMIVDMVNNKKPNPIVTEIFIWGKKLDISPVLLHNLILPRQKILD